MPRAGAVGLACAYSIINQGIASDLVLIDVGRAWPATVGEPARSRAPLCSSSCRSPLQIPQVQDKLKGEVADLQHGSAIG
jgi:hypothetical protein